jgi:phage FluMu protein Com
MIDYRCEKCGKLLRAPADAGGKQSRCPQCENVQTIPAASTAQAASSPFAGPPPGSPGANPFAAQMPQGSPFADPTNPYAAPAAYGGVQPHYTTAPGVWRPQAVMTGEILNRTWQIYKPNVMPLIGVALLMIVIGMAIGMATQILVMVVAQLAGETAGALFSMLNSFAQQFVSMWLQLGLAIFLLKTARGAAASAADLLAGGSYLLSMIGAMLLMMLIVAPLVLVCMLPGIIALAVFGEATIPALAFIAGAVVLAPVMMVFGAFASMLPYTIIDRNLGPIEALSATWELVRINKLTLVALILINTLLAMAGLIALCVGALFAYAFFFLSMAVAYLMISGQPTAFGYVPPA